MRLDAILGWMPIVWNIRVRVFRWICVKLCHDSPSTPRFSWHHWHRNAQWNKYTDVESDMAVKTTIALCEYHGAPTTRLYIPRGCVMNTDTALLSFPTFLGLPQLILCRNDDYFCYYFWLFNDIKWQVPLPPDAASYWLMLTVAVRLVHGAVWHSLTDSGWFYEHSVDKSSNLSSTLTNDVVQQTWLYRP